MRAVRRLAVFGQDGPSLGVVMNNPYPMGSVEREQWDAEYVPYNCTEALKMQAVGLSLRDPICPKPITDEQAAYWRSLPWPFRKAIPKWMIGEWLAYYGPLEPATLQDDNNANVVSHSAAAIGYNAYLMRVCGINRLYQSTCYGPDFDIGAVLSTILKSIAKIVSFIPGVGTIAASVLAGVGALVGGENIGAAAIEAAANAVPGGGIAKDAVMTGAKTAQSLAEGKDVGTALLDGARTALERQGVPVQVLQAFDIGVALGTGKGLQEAGFRMLKYYLPGNDVFERGTEFIDSMAKVRAIGTTAEKFLTTALSRDVYKAVGPGAMSALNDSLLEKVARSEEYRNMGSYDLAAVLGVQEAVARSAQVIGRYGYVDTVVRDQLLKSMVERRWEKYGMAAFEVGPLNTLFRTALAEKKEQTLMNSMNKNLATTYREAVMDQNVAGSVGRSKATFVYDPGNRVVWQKVGQPIIDSTPLYAFHQRKMATEPGQRFFAIGIGAIREGLLLDKLRETIAKAEGPTSPQAQGYNYALRVYESGKAVHPDVRVQLEAAGQMAASKDPIVMAARSQMRDVGALRGFDIAEGFLEGPPTQYTGMQTLEQVRDTLEPDPNQVRGFDSAVSVIRGRQQNTLPAGINSPEAAAAFFATAGLAGLSDKVVKAAVASSFADGAAREGTEAAIKAKSGIIQTIVRFFGLDTLFS